MISGFIDALLLNGRLAAWLQPVCRSANILQRQVFELILIIQRSAPTEQAQVSGSPVCALGLGARGRFSLGRVERASTQPVNVALHNFIVVELASSCQAGVSAKRICGLSKLRALTMTVYWKPTLRPTLGEAVIVQRWQQRVEPIHGACAREGQGQSRN